MRRCLQPSCSQQGQVGLPGMSTSTGDENTAQHYCSHNTPSEGRFGRSCGRAAPSCGSAADRHTKHQHPQMLPQAHLRQWLAFLLLLPPRPQSSHFPDAAASQITAYAPRQTQTHSSPINSTIVASKTKSNKHGPTCSIQLSPYTSGRCCGQERKSEQVSCTGLSTGPGAVGLGAARGGLLGAIIT